MNQSTSWWSLHLQSLRRLYLNGKFDTCESSKQETGSQRTEAALKPLEKGGFGNLLQPDKLSTGQRFSILCPESRARPLSRPWSGPEEQNNLSHVSALYRLHDLCFIFIFIFFQCMGSVHVPFNKGSGHKSRH